ncbi:MAG: DUF2258 domain-containing protein [Desulfurococcaceae archaeon]
MSIPFPRAGTRELSSGLIIAGAYASKIRRTLFAQLRDLAKQDRDFNREIARASAELNAVLFNVLVNELKVSKGDVVRIRINYELDMSTKKISWIYSSLRVEVFKKVPDDQVTQVVHVTTKEKLERILESFRASPRAAEEAVKAFESIEEEKPDKEGMQPLQVKLKLQDLIGAVDVIGETLEGGYLVKFTDKEGVSRGIATLTPSGDEVLIDAIIIHNGASSRYIKRSKGRPQLFVDETSRILSELEEAAPTPLSKEEAETIIREKMQSLL